MGIRAYLFFSFLLLAIVGIYTYSIIPSESAYYTLTMFGRSLELPIAVWFIIPSLVLLIASVAHMVFYSIKNFFTKRLMKKEYETLLSEIRYALLGEEKDFEYKSDSFKALSAAVKRMKFNPKSEDKRTGEKEVDEIYEILEKIRDGVYVDLKKFRLRSDNELLNQNRLNFAKDDKKSIGEVLKHCPALEGEACKKAFKALLEVASYAEIKSYKYKLTSCAIEALLKRFADQEDKFTLTVEEIKELLESGDFGSEEFLTSARILKTALDPDLLLKLYDNLQQKNYKATFSYLYILFELRLIDKAREFLDGNEDSEFEKFRILLFLRDNGKFVDTDYLIC
ncbi:MAG: hypothetical protein LBQ18_04525 [Campylobacteraceae bacterium]|jgi:ABC-type transport system involved in cytochrome c biogenesis permease subunit|nr:hypothetical protein [Campylobacteraceae bacterium]